MYDVGMLSNIGDSNEKDMETGFILYRLKGYLSACWSLTAFIIMAWDTSYGD